MTPEGSPQPDRSGGRRTLWGVAAIILLAAVLRLAGLTSLPFAQDELYTFEDSLDFGESWNARPLYYALCRLLLFVLPHQPELLRWPAAIFGIAGVWLTWSVGRRILGETSGLVGALMVALSQWHLLASQLARYWSLVYLLAIVALYVLIRAHEADETKLYLISICVLGAGFLAHPTFAFPFVGILPILYVRTQDGVLRWTKPSRKARLCLWYPILTVATIGFVLLWTTGQLDIFRNYYGRGLVANLRIVPAVVQWLGPAVVAGALVGTLLLWLSPEERHRRWALLSASGVTTALVLLLVFSGWTDVYAEYGMAFLPIVYLNLGALVQRILEMATRKRLAVGIGLTAVFLVSTLPGTASYLSDGARYDFDAVFRQVRERGPDRLIVGKPTVFHEYLAPELPFTELHMDPDFLEGLLEDRRGFWLVGRYRRYGLVEDPDGRVTSWIREHCRLEFSRSEPRLDYRIYRLELHWCGEGPAP